MESTFQSIKDSVKHWYVLLLIGILFILCGVYVLSTPIESYLALSILFSISFITSGIFDIFFSARNSKNMNGWGWYLVSGLLSLAIGFYLLTYIQISIVILPFFVGFTLVFRSFQLLGFSIELKNAGVLSWGNVAIVSILGVIFSFMLLGNPIFSGISIITLTTLSFIFIGIAYVLLSFRLRKLERLSNKIMQVNKSN